MAPDGRVTDTDPRSDDTEGLEPPSAVFAWIRRSGKRIAVTIVGFLVLLAGVIMIVTPGPGWLAIIAGLAILSTEWAWAERALDRAKQQAKRTLETATGSPLLIALSVTLTLAAIAGVLVWFFVIR